MFNLKSSCGYDWSYFVISTFWGKYSLHMSMQGQFDSQSYKKTSQNAEI